MLSISGVDSHFHIFRTDLPMVAGRRYTPAYNALIEQQLENMQRCGLSHGVLVQPSFLGTDNSFMLDALRRHPERLRGTAVVDPDISDDEIDALQAGGVVGIRLNLIGQTLDTYTSPQWHHFFRRLVRHNWSVEIQRGIDDLALIVPQILESGVPVVIDHFGLPPGGIDRTNAKHRAFLSLLADGNVWIKLSAAYRAPLSPEQSVDTLHALRDAYGHSDRFVWGSDWPHTQFEQKTGYDAQVALMQALLPDIAERQKILVNNPVRLFQFKTLS